MRVARSSSALRLPLTLAAALLAASTAARAQAPARVSYAPAGWDAGTKLREAVDINPDPTSSRSTSPRRSPTWEWRPARR